MTFDQILEMLGKIVEAVEAGEQVKALGLLTLLAQWIAEDAAMVDKHWLIENASPEVAYQ